MYIIHVLYLLVFSRVVMVIVGVYYTYFVFCRVVMEVVGVLSGCHGDCRYVLYLLVFCRVIAIIVSILLTCVLSDCHGDCRYVLCIILTSFLSGCRSYIFRHMSVVCRTLRLC